MEDRLRDIKYLLEKNGSGESASRGKRHLQDTIVQQESKRRKTFDQVEAPDLNQDPLDKATQAQENSSVTASDMPTSAIAQSTVEISSLKELKCELLEEYTQIKGQIIDLEQ